MRPTTEQGGRWERCNFTFGFVQDVSPTGTPQSNVIQLIGGNSMIASMALAGTEAEAVARMLQNPMRDFEVKALVMDVDAWAINVQDRNNSLAFYDDQVCHTGIAVFTQQLDEDGSPVTVPPYWLSQWPVNQQVSGLSQFNEDRDYATRTHLSRAFTLCPSILYRGPGEALPVAGFQGKPYAHHYIKLRINRRLGDKHALFFGSWTSNPGASGMLLNAIQFLIHGSLWYKMKF